MVTYFFSSTWTRAKAFQKLLEHFSNLQSFRQPQIDNLLDHTHDIEMVMDKGENDPRLHHQYQVTCGLVQSLADEWRDDIADLKLKYHALFAPVSEQEADAFEEAYETVAGL